MTNDDRINLPSLSNLAIPITDYWTQFPSDWSGPWPDDDGWIRSAVFSGHNVGRIGLRDALNARVTALVGRDQLYSKHRATQLMAEGQVLDRCTWMNSIPVMAEPTLAAIAEQLATSKPRRNRRHGDLIAQPTDCSSGSG